jgi:hypothetical protein
MNLELIDTKVREYLKKSRTPCVLLYIDILNETDEYIECIAHLQCKRTRKIRKVIMNKFNGEVI